MNINLTLVVQMLVFAVFVWFTMKFVWPPLVKALDERQEKIADGLAAAERGRRELELAQHRAKDEMKHAKVQSAEIVEKANRRAGQIIDEAKEDARAEVQQMAKIAQEHIAQEVNRAKAGLRKQVAALAVKGAEQILRKEVNASVHADLLGRLKTEL